MVLFSRISMHAMLNVSNEATTYYGQLFITHSFEKGALGGAGGDINRADLKGAREVLRASRWCLSGHRGSESKESDGVLHGV